MSAGRVLVTGGGGFIAGHCILQLLEAGYEVVATVRSRGREQGVRQALTAAGMTAGDRLSFLEADLTADAGWAEAMRGIDQVLHVASPVQPGHVEDEDDLIVPAREGALRVLRAAHDAAVTRVVLTSAFHAVGWGHPRDDRTFTEADWSVLDGPGVDAYGKSKTLAERAAWEYARETGLDLVTLLPVAVMGPLLGGEVSGANHLVQRLLEGEIPALPHVFIPIVDVRDVARAHVLALQVPEAGGERFLITHGSCLELVEIGAVLREALGPAATKVPTRTLPNVVVRLVALVNPQLREVVPDLGYQRRTSPAKAHDVLGWTARDPREAIIAAGRSLLDRA